MSSESWTPVCRRVTSSRARASARLADSARVWASSSTSRSRRRSSCRPRSRSSAPARLSSARAPATPICSDAQRLVAPAATEEGGAAGRESRLDLVRPTSRRSAWRARASASSFSLSVPLCAERLAPVAEASDLPGEARVLLAEIADLRAHLLAPLEQALGLALDLLHRLPEVGEPVLGLLDGRRLERVPRAEAGDARALALLGLAAAPPSRGSAPRAARRARPSRRRACARSSACFSWCSALYWRAFLAWRSMDPSCRRTSSITSRTRVRFWRVASSLPCVSARCCL